MILPPCLSLVLALVPTAQEPNLPAPDPWIELPSAREISMVSLKQGVLTIEVTDAKRGVPIQTEIYDKDSYPDGGAKPTKIVEAGTVVRGPLKDIRRALPKTADRADVSADYLTAITVEQPPHLGGAGEVTLYTYLGGGWKPESRTRTFPSFVNANLAPDGKTVYVQVSARMEQWGWANFLNDGRPVSLAITGEYTNVFLPGSDRKALYSDYFLLQTPTALEVYKGIQAKPKGIELPGGHGSVPIDAAVGKVNTTNYATYAHMDATTGYVVVTDRQSLYLRRVAGEEGFLDLGEFSPKVRKAEIRSCWYVPPDPDAVAGSPFSVVLGLTSDFQATTIEEDGHCKVAAWILDCDPAGKSKPIVRYRTPWLGAERWNRVSPGLHLADDGQLLFVSTNGRVWRFEVQS